MEDLVARGVEFCHATKPQSRELVARRLAALAAFHAQTWDSPELAPDGTWSDLVDFFDVMRGFFDRYTDAEHWQRFVHAPRGAATSVRFHDRDWMIDGWTRVSRYGQSLPQCVLHGDVHLGNLYLDTDGEPGFFDPLASRGPGMLEVSYHVSASVDVADRAQWEGALVRGYLEELRRHGVDAPPFDEAMRQYAVFLLYGLFIWLTTESHYQPEAVNTANAARVSAAMLDHDSMRPVSSRTWSTMRLCVQYPVCRNCSADIVPSIPLGPVFERFGVAPSIGGGLPHPTTPSAMRPTRHTDATNRMGKLQESSNRKRRQPLYLARPPNLAILLYAGARIASVCARDRRIGPLSVPY